MRLDLDEWSRFAGRGPFDVGNVPAFAQISFGQTSAVMAALLAPAVRLLFENTGREHSKTLEFGARLEDALQRPITWLEWRPPATKGAPPREFGFAVVTYETAARNGEPFRGFLEAMRDYRATKGAPPVAPWARGRICTAHLKHRVKEHYVASLGIDAYDTFVGLRADEPDRVAGLKGVESVARTFRMPLDEVGITKGDVDRFWSRQSFSLGLDPHQGNCTGCFLKDEGDLSRVLVESDTDADWWEGIADEYPDFGGRRFVGYSQLRSEYPTRIAIEGALRAGREPLYDSSMDQRRFRLVVRQEQRRLAGDRPGFSCACEQTVKLADEDDEEADRQLLLWAPRAKSLPPSPDPKGGESR